MSSHPTNDLGSQPAHPTYDNAGAGLGLREWGLTKRELFAAMAMQSLIAKAPVQELLASDPGTLPTMCARGAVDYADALLTALREVQS